MFSSFDGSSKRTQQINLRGRSKKEDKASLLQKARLQREARQQARREQKAVELIQMAFRRHRAILQWREQEIARWERSLQASSPPLSAAEGANQLAHIMYILSPRSLSPLPWRLVQQLLCDDTRTGAYRQSTDPALTQSRQEQLSHIFVLCCRHTMSRPLGCDLSVEVDLLNTITKMTSLSAPLISSSGSLLPRMIKKYMYQEHQLCQLLFRVVQEQTGQDTGDILPSLVEQLLIGKNDQLDRLPEYFREALCALLPHLPISQLLRYASGEVKNVLIFLLKLAQERKDILPLLLASVDVKTVQDEMLHSQNQADTDSDEEWMSDDDDTELDLFSKNLYHALVQFLDFHGLKQLSAEAFPAHPTGASHDHLLMLCRFSLLLKLVDTNHQHFYQMLNQLAFSFRAVPPFWRNLKQLGILDRGLTPEGEVFSKEDSEVLCFFALLCYRWLLAVDDYEFFDSQIFLSLEEWVHLTHFWKRLAISQCEYRYGEKQDRFQPALFEAAVPLLRILYERDCRRSYMDEGWVSPEVTVVFHQKEENQSEIVNSVPYFIPLDDRFNCFQTELTRRKRVNLRFFQSRERQNLQIKRESLFQDGYNALSGMSNEAFLQKFRVTFVNDSGLAEAGIDGGGLFKEFITEMLHQGFNPDSGLFTYALSKELYPNPTASQTVEDWEQMYYFMGRLLGKSLFESALVYLPLSKFFIARLLHKTANYVNDLSVLDPQMYKNLIVLKNYSGNVEEDFSLTFSVSERAVGQDKIVDLIPNGRNKPVTSQNRMKYIFLVARYRVNTQIKPQVDSFLRGFHDIIPSECITMFNEEELQQLISGFQGPLDLQDFRAHTEYHGGYTNDHPVVEMFWQVMESFNPEQQRKFLRFVTSAERSPLLGFQFLEPRFGIQKSEDQERLPTAGTCFNLLKLPPYSSFTVMREKLLYAIESQSGFELS